MRSGQGDYLFCSADWFSVEESQRRKLHSEIDAINGNRLLNTSVDDLCGYFEDKFRIDVPMLHEDQAVADQQETQIDVSQDSMRSSPAAASSAFIMIRAVRRLPSAKGCTSAIRNIMNTARWNYVSGPRQWPKPQASVPVTRSGATNTVGPAWLASCLKAPCGLSGRPAMTVA